MVVITKQSQRAHNVIECRSYIISKLPKDHDVVEIVVTLCIYMKYSMYYPSNIPNASVRKRTFKTRVLNEDSNQPSRSHVLR